VEMSSLANVEGSRRHRWRFTLGVKVALVLGLLVVTNLAVGLAGLRAVAVTDRQADLLYAQSLKQVRDLTELGDALDQTYQHALRLIPTNAAPKLVEIGGQLDQESIPAVQRALEVVEREQADQPPAVRALVQRLRVGWQRFLKLRRSGRYELTSAIPGFARLNDALTEETARVFATMQAAVDQLTDHELQRAGNLIPLTAAGKEGAAKWQPQFEYQR